MLIPISLAPQRVESTNIEEDLSGFSHAGDAFFQQRYLFCSGRPKYMAEVLLRAILTLAHPILWARNWDF